MVAIDALVIHDYKTQFQQYLVKRELNKVATICQDSSHQIVSCLPVDGVGDGLVFCADSSGNVSLCLILTCL